MFPHALVLAARLTVPFFDRFSMTMHFRQSLGRTGQGISPCVNAFTRCKRQLTESKSEGTHLYVKELKEGTIR